MSLKQGPNSNERINQLIQQASEIKKQSDLEKKLKINNNNGYVEDFSKESKKYNENVKNYDPSKFNDFKLLGNFVLIKPFKLFEEKTKGGIVINTKNYKEKVNENTGRIELEQLNYPYQYEGIVVKVGENCSTSFKENVKEGDRVSFSRINWPVVHFVLDSNKVYTGEDELHVRINENMIERVYNV